MPGRAEPIPCLRADSDADHLPLCHSGRCQGPGAGGVGPGMQVAWVRLDLLVQLPALEAAVRALRFASVGVKSASPGC